jgi:hypothetical protein
VSQSFDSFCVLHDVSMDVKANAISVHVAAINNETGLYDLEGNKILATLLLYQGASLVLCLFFSK